MMRNLSAETATIRTARKYVIDAALNMDGLDISGQIWRLKKMSDDLISRKALINILKVVDKDGLLTILTINQIIDFIENQPTAFDKEKVIEELYRYTAEECELHECGIRSEYCNVCMAKKAIEIVEKGGIE